MRCGEPGVPFHVEAMKRHLLPVIGCLLFSHGALFRPLSLVAADAKAATAAKPAGWQVKEARRLAAHDRDGMRADAPGEEACLAELAPYASEETYKAYMRKEIAAEEAGIARKAIVMTEAEIARRADPNIPKAHERTRDEMVAKYTAHLRIMIAQKRARYQIGPVGDAEVVKIIKTAPSPTACRLTPALVSEGQEYHVGEALPVPPATARELRTIFTTPGNVRHELPTCEPNYGVRFTFASDKGTVVLDLCLECSVLRIETDINLTLKGSFKSVSPRLIAIANALFPEDKKLQSLTK
jgi:hypothetical protein